MSVNLFLLWIFLIGGALSAVTATGLTINVTETDADVDISSGMEGCTLPQGWSRINITKYFRITDTGSLHLVNPLDLEVLVNKISRPGFNFTINCINSVTPQMNVTVNIEPINEFQPVFLNSPFTTSLKENQENTVLVFQLKAYDIDAFKFNKVSNFSFEKYPVDEIDGRRYFYVDSSSGNVFAKKTFDYEALHTKYFMFFIRAMDDGGLSSPTQTSLNITISDVDDMPPVFVRRACDVNCLVSGYTAVIDWNHTGPVAVYPILIYAIDGDRGVNDNVTFSIIDVQANNLASNVHIDPTSGEITVQEAFVNITDRPGADPFHLQFTVQAEEVSQKKHSTNTTLNISVYRQLPTTTPLSTTHPTTPTAAEEIAEEEEKPNWLIIVLTPTILCLILLVGIGVLLIRKRQRMMEKKKYKVRENAKEIKLRSPSIGAISASPINPYELVSNYAHIDLSERASFDYENISVQPEEESQPETDIGKEVSGNASKDKVIEGMYARVERRKQKTKKSKIPEFSVTEDSSKVNTAALDPLNLPVDKDLPPDIKPFEFSEENMHY